MKTAGQLLRDTRLEKGFELTDVARITRIRHQFLTSIEADDYSHLPTGATARGFIRNYSEFLGLKPDYVLAIFRRDFVENRQGQIVPRGLSEPIAKPNFWTPKSTIITIVVGIFVLFSSYIVYQYRILTGPPPLTLAEPAQSLTTTQTSIIVAGSTDPQATVSVNDQLVALENGGQFSLRLSLTPGLNTIQIAAISKSGKKTLLTREVVLTTPD